MKINNILYKIFFIVLLNYLQSRMKYIRQGLQFSWFFKRATTSGIKLGLRSNSTKYYVIKRSPSNLCSVIE
jgi:hypothetical protein